MMRLDTLKKLKEYLDEKGIVRVSELVRVFRVRRSSIIKALKLLEELDYGVYIEVDKLRIFITKKYIREVLLPRVCRRHRLEKIHNLKTAE